MTSKQRAYLKSLAMTMDPIFQVGKASVTPELIGALDRQGVFSTKGAVGQAARELDISEPTVYRYLRRVRNR